MKQTKWYNLASVFMAVALIAGLALTSESRERIRILRGDRSWNDRNTSEQSTINEGEDSILSFGSQRMKEVIKFLRTLDLTDEQKEALKSLRQESKNVIRPALQTVADLRERIHEEATSSAPDEAKIRELSAQVGKIVGDIAVQASSTYQKLKGILTPEQMAKVNEALAKRKTLRQSRRESLDSLGDDSL